MKKIIKNIFINILVLIALLMIVDFGSMLIFDTVKATSGLRKSVRGTSSLNKSVEENLSELPNYNNAPWAKLHFNELKTMRADYKSYYGWRRKEFKGVTINVDSCGIRTTTGVQNNELPAVVFLGGSTMWGTGANDEGTIPSIFHKKTDGKYNVLNYGESAYNAYQSSVFLQTQLAKGLLNNIDLIITCDGVNNSYFYKKYFTHFREKQINNLLQGQDSQKEKYLFMQYTRTLITKIINKIKYTPPPEVVLTEKENRQAATELLNSWLVIKSIAEVNNASFFCILQPNAFVGNPNLSNFQNGVDSTHKDEYKYYTYVREYLSNDRKYSELEKHFIDMTNVFDNKPNVYIDFCHVTPNGNELIVDNILNHLKK